MTTAQYRESAREAERLLLWNSAACLWEKAIANYPNPASAMAKADIARMRERMESCKCTLKAEVAQICDPAR